VRGSPEKILA